MILRFFKRFHATTPLLLILAGLAFWADGLLPADEGHFPFARLAALTLLLAQSFYLNHIVTSQGLLERQSYHTALVYLVLMSSHPEMLRLHPVLFSNIFLMIALHQVFRTYKEETVLVEVFNAGMLIAVAGIFFPPALLFFLFLVLSLFVFYIIDLRSFIAALLGFAAPFFFAGLYFFLTDSLQDRLGSYSYSLVAMGFPSPELSLPASILLILLGLYGLLAFSHLLFSHIPDQPIRVRKRYWVLIHFLLVALLTVFFGQPFRMEHMGLVFLPLGVGLAAYFQLSRNRLLPEILFTLLLLIILADKWFGF